MSRTIGTFQSSSNPEKFYTVTEGNDGVVYCSCPAWKFQRLAAAMRSCKHTKSAAASNLAKAAPVLGKSVAGHLLATATAKNAARRSAHDLHKAMKAGGDAAKVAAQAVLMDTTSGFSKNLRAMALSIVMG